MKKYGLQLRTVLHQKRNTCSNFIIPSAFDDEGDDVELDISRQAGKDKAAKVEEQYKHLLEEDPSAFDYDFLYDEMKEKEIHRRVQDREEKKPRYITALMQKAKAREREHDIIYERKLARERSKEDELYADKDKFVTGAYKKKLMEQTKWLEEERIRECRESKDDVTKKSDLSDFYYNLSKNVAFGGNKDESTTPCNNDRDAKNSVGGTQLAGGSAICGVSSASSDVTEVSAARERFLARKRAKLERE